MNKKKKKKHKFNLWKQKERKEYIFDEHSPDTRDYDYLRRWRRDCHKAKWVNITPDIKVFCGMPDDDTKKACKQELDVFFALSWGDYEEWNKNNFHDRFRPIRKFFDRKELHAMSTLLDANPNNIADAYIAEGEINEGIAFIIEQTVRKGAKVGFGCTGGHGRTGWVLARLLHTIGGHPLGDDLIKLTRDLLCVQAIESNAQITNLGGTAYKPETLYSYQLKNGKWVSVTAEDTSPNQRLLQDYDPKARLFQNRIESAAAEDHNNLDDDDKDDADKDPCEDPFYSDDACRGIDIKRYI
jgi:hypothetical protein